MNWSAKIHIGSNMSTPLWSDAILTAFLITVIIFVLVVVFLKGKLAAHTVVKYSPIPALECSQTVYYYLAISNFCLPLSKEQTISEREYIGAFNVLFWLLEIYKSEFWRYIHWNDLAYSHKTFDLNHCLKFPLIKVKVACWKNTLVCRYSFISVHIQIKIIATRRLIKS